MSYLEQLCTGHDLSTSQAEAHFAALLQGKLSDIEMAGLLIALKAKGEAPTEIIGALKAMQQHATPFPALDAIRTQFTLIDCVGTGGDNQHSLNISTPSAIMAATFGLKIAKHGNRAVSSQCGTADLLESVGINITMSPEIAKKTLLETGFTFLFAPLYHPAMHRVRKIRTALKTRTIFNLLGPLLNPTQPQILLVGVYHPALCQLFANVLRLQGARRALIVHGQGLDEFALHGPTTGTLLLDNHIHPFTLTPEQAGLQRFSLQAIQGQDVAFNQQQFLNLLKGHGNKAYRCAVALNTGVLLWLTEIAPSIRAGVDLVLNALESDVGYQLLLKIQEVSHATGNN